MKNQAFRSTVLICSCASLLSAAEPVSVTKETAFTFYGGFKRLTTQPYRVAPLTARLCAMPSPELVEREKRATGPHYKVRIHLYANAVADDAMIRKLDTFPTGSIIVKEKLAADDSVAGVGGMIKRAPGYDAANGDWDYFYSDKGGAFFAGRLQNCADCHASAKASDYVFSARKHFE